VNIVEIVLVVSSFALTEHFDTTPEMASRTYNRLRTEQVSEVTEVKDDRKGQNNECAQQYKELNSRIKRHQQLKTVTQKMTTKKELMVNMIV